MKFATLLVLLAIAAVADASRENVFSRSLLSDDYKKPIYCKKDHDDYHDDCPEHYECKPLDKRECKSEQVCKTDGYGRKDCHYDNVCWDYKCVEVPKYCDPYAKYDDCDKKYGDHMVCKKLDKEVCKYKDECKKIKTHCTEYDHEDKCHYVQGKCIDYEKKKECKKEQFCVEYKKIKKCEKKQFCKDYHKKQECKKTGKCADYDAYGNCKKYGEDCHYVNAGCKEYGYREHDCEYVPTKECIKYDHKETDCHYVNTHCKKYAQDKKCEKVQKGCKKYAYKDECHKVKDVCWKGICEKRPPPPPPKKRYGGDYSG